MTDKEHLQKSIIRLISSDHYRFIKYISQRKKYIFEVINRFTERFDSIEINVSYDQKYFTIYLKSVHDKSLANCRYVYHEDGIYNRFKILVNSTSLGRDLPEAMKFRYGTDRATLESTLRNIFIELVHQRIEFFEKDLRSDPKLIKGLKCLNELSVDKEELADDLDREVHRGGKRIENETFKWVFSELKKVWIFSDRERSTYYRLEDDLYYYALNILYTYINEGREKRRSNILYRYWHW